MNLWHGEGVHPGVVEARLIPHIPITLEALLSDPQLQRPMSPEALERAVARLDQALAINAVQVARIHGAAAEIVGAQRLMLASRSFVQPMRDDLQAGRAASDALARVVEQLTARLSRSDSALVREKIQDVRDLAAQLAGELLDRDGEIGAAYIGAIVAVPQPLASTLFQLLCRKIAGVAIFDAGITSHLSIIASSLGIPAVIFPFAMPAPLEPGVYRLDGGRGVLARAGLETEARSRTPRFVAMGSRMAFSTVPAREDAPELWVNLNLPSEAPRAVAHAAGVGLYRSEFSWGLAGRVLEEEEQYQDYRAIVETFRGKRVHLRTADVGGDKILRGLEQPAEANPFLGARGVRASLRNRGLFRRQLRALLRAGLDADLGIMLPMVTSVEEVNLAKEELAFARFELQDAGVPHNARPRLGVMIETPAAALAVEHFAEAVDFLSIGTNDLVMYLLAVDRTNSRLSGLYSPLHPIVLQIVARAVRAAKAARVHLSVCGQSAANPNFLPFLIGLGVDAVSVALPRLESARAMLDECSAPFCRAYANRLLAAPSATAVERIVGSE